jgi:hypothetical protein
MISSVSQLVGTLEPTQKVRASSFLEKNLIGTSCLTPNTRNWKAIARAGERTLQLGRQDFEGQIIQKKYRADRNA